MKLRSALVCAVLSLSGCAGSHGQVGHNSVWTVVRYIDGDTIDVRNTFGHVERVRFIGIDTPEKGECGYEAATGALALLIKDSKVKLVSGAQTNRDRMKEPRLLRYVEVDGRDIGLAMIKGGWAIAAYDSRQTDSGNYGSHVREDLYRATDENSPNQCPDMSPGRS